MTCGANHKRSWESGEFYNKVIDTDLTLSNLS